MYDQYNREIENGVVYGLIKSKGNNANDSYFLAMYHSINFSFLLSRSYDYGW